MTNRHSFNVAGLTFSIILPDGWDAESLLPSFQPFQCTAKQEEGEGHIFTLQATVQPCTGRNQCATPLDESTNDMGHVCLLRNGSGYRMEIDYGNTVHVMTTDSTFSHATAHLCPADPHMGTVLSSMVRILYSQVILLHDGISIHASCVCLQGKAYLFLGKSGTGKSTHARQWMAAFPGCRLLNDDNPILRATDGMLAAYGSPWSGKTPCYRNETCPVAGIVRLQQATANKFTPLQGPEAFISLLPSCSAIRQDTTLQDALHNSLAWIARHVPVARMQCLPDTDAAHVCMDALGTYEGTMSKNTHDKQDIT